MEAISAAELYEWYEDTITRCGTYLLGSDETLIGENVFEDFDIGVHSFLSEYALDVLLKNNFIRLEQADKSRELRRITLELQDAGEWQIELFGQTDNWKKLLSLADEIRASLNIAGKD